MVRVGRRAHAVGQVQLITAADVQTMAEVVNSDVTIIDVAIPKCPGLDASTWPTAKAAALGWVESARAYSWTQGTSAEVYDQGKGLHAVMQGWAERLAAAGCTVNLPVAPTPRLSTANPAVAPLVGFLGQVPPLLMLGLVYLIAREMR